MQEERVPTSRIKNIDLDEFNKILAYLKGGKPTHVRDEALLEILGFTLKNYKALQDRLTYMENHGFLVYEKCGRKNTWRLKLEKQHILTQITQNDIVNLDYAMELGKEHFTQETHETFKKIFEADPKLLGKFGMFEKMQSEKLQMKIKTLLEAIENKYYIDITLDHDTKGIGKYREIKPIKIVFTDDNWYLAFEYKEKQNSTGFRLGRIAFIDEDITFSKDFAYSTKKSFQAKEIQKYIDFLKDDLQNAMTLYGEEKKVATLKAKGFISMYFKEGMKKFFSTQKFIEELEDGSAIFTIAYTQELEILPFVQKWMPDLLILEPQELKDAYRKKLQLAIENST